MTNDPYGTDPQRPHPGRYSYAGGNAWLWLGGLAIIAVIVALVMWGGSVNEGEKTAGKDSLNPPASAPATTGSAPSKSPAPNR